MYTDVCYNSMAVPMQRLIREEWESLQSKERDEEERQEKARREKEVTIPFILTNILIVTDCMIINYIQIMTA